MKTLMLGYLATYVVTEGKKVQVEMNPLTILNFYKDKKYDGHKLTEKRGVELAAAIEWALNEIPPDVIETQTDLEK